MTRKSLPSWPQCWASHVTVETVTMFQQSHKTKFVRSWKKREPRMEGTAEPWVLGRECWAASYCFADFHRRKGCRTPYSDYTTLKPCGRCRDLLDREWSDCASVSTGCPQRGHEVVSGLSVGTRTWWVERKERRWSMRQTVTAIVRLPTWWLLTLKEKGEGNGARCSALWSRSRGRGAVQETSVPRYCIL